MFLFCHKTYSLITTITLPTHQSFEGGDIKEDTLAFLENARFQLPALGSCREPFKLPLNVQYKCQDGINTCKLTCKNNYYFPEGLSSLNIVCMNGKWIIEGVEWSELPSCTREFINFFLFYILILLVVMVHGGKLVGGQIFIFSGLENLNFKVF